MWDNEQSANAGDEWFAKVDDVSSGGQRLPYLLDGLYVLQIDKIVFLLTREKVPLYIAEFTILESNNEARPVGMQVSWASKMNIDMGPINVKRFVGAAVGYSTTEDIDANITADISKFSASRAQPFTGVQVYCQVRQVKTKKQTDFTEHLYSPIQGYSWNDLNPSQG